VHATLLRQAGRALVRLHFRQVSRPAGSGTGVWLVLIMMEVEKTEVKGKSWKSKDGG
jgi:hypothetical protein